MSSENPFRENRLNTSRNFRPEWDVPELNQTIAKWLVDEVDYLKGRKEPDPGQMIAAMTGPPGYGKTHLFGRIEHLVGHEVFFVFVPAFEEQTAPLDHIRWHVIDSSFRAPEGGHSPLEVALARLCRPAFARYFAELPPSLAARHEAIRRQLEELPEAVFKIVRQVKNLTPFLKLAESLINVLPQDAAIVRALALGWAPTPWSDYARRWLQGQDLPDAERLAVGLGEDSPSALEVMRAIPALFGYERPMIVCCDQIEGLLQGNAAESINRLSTSMMDLLQSVPVQIVLSCFADQLEKFYKHTFPAFKMRVKQPSFRLDLLQPEQAVRLVTARIAAWPDRRPDRRPTWPFNEASLSRFVRDNKPTPRALIQKCDQLFVEWLEQGIEQEIHFPVNKPDTGTGDLEILFVQEWQREIEDISQSAERSAAQLQEDRLYRGIFEALKLAHSAQRLRTFGGVRIVDIRDNSIKSTPAAKRAGALVTLASGPGEDAQTILVALTKLEAAGKLSHYFNALFAATTDSVAGAVLIHPRRDLVLGAKTRTQFDAAQREGKLRLLALEDYPMTCHATECLAAMLDRALARELVLGGVMLSAEDCRDLVIRTGLIDNLDLFKMLGHWKRRTAAVSNATTDSTVASVPPSVIPILPATVPHTSPTVSQPIVQPPAAPVTPPATPATSSAKPVATDSSGWATKKLADAVRKLNLLGQSVEPDGFEIGPTFARLRVRPIGKTNFKGVSNKAVDLRIYLGLDVVPIVGSQAGCISIDIQRPDRTVVTLAEALADAPQALANKPAFPVGKDVAGQSHWLNLADPSDCHLLVAGTTGSGKSEFLRAVLGSLAARLGPEQIQFLLIDPKRVTFNFRSSSPFLRFPIAHDLDEALPIIEKCMVEMDRRYKLLESRKLSDVSELTADLMPRIVIVIDEFAGFLEDKESKKTVTALLKRLGAMARAAGIHLIVSTQRPDKDVVTPLLRENLPGRISLRVSSKAGSDLILGVPDAEHLLGRGDLFWKRGGELLRLQSPFIPQAELERLLRCDV
jgi:S-DNA-T family DNA segregation ATPase FtsK/SpoIIIE